ncbi:MAG: glycosyltransferase family 4 protein [bacterium]|nr:glycosyltransferase family 4 protein [bacterium]
MKIVFYSPYLPKHFGGGEKYFFDVALTYAQKHQVFIALPANIKKTDLEKIKSDYQDFLQRDLSTLNFIISPFGANSKRLQKIFWTSKFDVVYFVTDGSAFFSLARRSIMHIQVPLVLQRKNWWEKCKFRTFNIINSNSQFTKKVVEKYWGVKVNLVCQPGIDTAQFAPTVWKKEKIILNVGRFFDQLHCKNQVVLVEFFRALLEKYPQEMQGWKLILIGKVESEAYVNQVRKLAAGLPIVILTEVNHQDLIRYYQKAAIYWHATGFYDDPLKNPEKMEHFGISTVEAMAAGCVPVVIGKGGQTEILGHDLSYLSWITQAECLKKTLQLIKNPKRLLEIGHQAQKRADKFNLKAFEKKCWQQLEMKK